MFGISFEKLFVLIVVALFVLGPERLPAAAAWVARTTRKAKAIAGGASQQLREDYGDQFDQLREPLRQLQELGEPLARMQSLRDPRSALLRYVLDPDAATSPTPPAPPRPGAPSSPS